MRVVDRTRCTSTSRRVQGQVSRFLRGGRWTGRWAARRRGLDSAGQSSTLAIAGRHRRIHAGSLYVLPTSLVYLVDPEADRRQIGRGSPPVTAGRREPTRSTLARSRPRPLSEPRAKVESSQDRRGRGTVERAPLLPLSRPQEGGLAAQCPMVPCPRNSAKRTNSPRDSAGSGVRIGAGAGVRTLTPLRAAEFKSAASACSATPARRIVAGRPGAHPAAGPQ